MIYRSDGWLSAVRALPCCVLCGQPGVQAAHRNEGKGLSVKVDDCLTAAICTECHRDIDQGAHLTRYERRERLDRAILLTIAALARMGAIGVTGTESVGHSRRTRDRSRPSKGNTASPSKILPRRA